MRAGFALVALAVLVGAACHALPSAIPLADEGKAVPSAPERDRRSVTVGGDGTDEVRDDDADDEVVVEAQALPGKEAVASAPDAGSDAGPAEAAPDAAAPNWPGEYYGSDRFVRRFESGPEEVQVDDKAHTRVERPAAGSLVISVVNSASGEVICALKAREAGRDATLEPGQSCFSDEERVALVTSGRAKLDGDLLTLDFEGRIEGDDDEDLPEGNDSYHFEGKRRAP